MTWYNTGTVTVTPGSNVVIGVGTAFIRNARVGDGFRGPDGGWYEITNIASDTALSITPAYGAPSAYAVAPLQGYVKDSADALREATRTIAGGIADMEEQVAAATEAAESAGQSKTVATEQATFATDAAALSTSNKNASQQAAEQSQSSAGASDAAAVRAESARDSIVQSEQAAADSAEAAAQSAEHAEQAAANKANKGANSDITSLSGLTTPLSVAQGGNGAIAPKVITDANAALNNGRYATPGSGWVGEVLPSPNARGDGYLTHDNFGADYAVQTWKSIYADVLPRTRWKFAGTWGSWVEQSPGAAWGAISGTLSNQADLKAALDGKLGSTQADFAIVYPNGGSSAAPATVATNARYITDNPFPGFHVMVQIDLLVGGVWSDPGWDGNTGSGGSTYGAIAAQSLPSDKVIVQTGTSSVATASNLLGGGHGITSTTPTTSAPCRVKVWKLKGAVT
ncbi:hypothetical protein [Pseudomonas sp. TE24901]